MAYCTKAMELTAQCDLHFYLVLNRPILRITLEKVKMKPDMLQGLVIHMIHSPSGCVVTMKDLYHVHKMY